MRAYSIPPNEKIYIYLMNHDLLELISTRLYIPLNHTMGIQKLFSSYNITVLRSVSLKIPPASTDEPHSITTDLIILEWNCLLNMKLQPWSPSMCLYNLTLILQETEI